MVSYQEKNRLRQQQQEKMKDMANKSIAAETEAKEKPPIENDTDAKEAKRTIRRQTVAKKTEEDDS